ncbi:hypothetical protein CG471_11730 [Sphingobium sp. IP1]|uniref:phage tail terminator protein n=1 Tax=Sphingobium sp. IP1 TaxID=2021637 RepID=UPI000C078CF6|nr:hypothetical protein [Sphingobium sp. IP1]PHP19522.1 hypothetical protein CG471_11730 [Sphingobium sp. IP1]
MISQKPIVARLKSVGLRNVEGILEWAGLTEAPRASPAFFVAPEADSAAPNSMGTRVLDQKLTEQFGVIVVVEGRAHGSEMIDDRLKVEVDRVMDALILWTHPEAGRPTEYGGGRLLSADGYRVAWMVRFTTSRHIRKESQ